jgi:hypothetical protein
LRLSSAKNRFACRQPSGRSLHAGRRIIRHRPATTPTTADNSRHPIGRCGGQIGLAIAFDNLWLLQMLVPFALVIRYGVVAREETYLERKFGDLYRDYRLRVRRWL